MTLLIKGEMQEIFFLFCAGLAMMLLFAARNMILKRCILHKYLWEFFYLIFWIIAAFLFYEFAYIADFGCISWYSLTAFGCAIVLWNKKLCDIITLYHTVKIQDRDGKNEKKNKGAYPKIRRKDAESRGIQK